MINIKNEQLIMFKILIHSDMLYEFNLFKIFLELNLTEYIEIDVTPTEDIEIIEKLKSYNIEVPKYHISNNGISMLYSNGFKNFRCYKDIYSKQLNKLKSKLTNEDLLFSKYYNIFIVDKNDPFIKLGYIKNVKTINEAKRQIGISFSNNNIFLFRPHYKVNEGYYYLIRAMKDFPLFQKPWFLIIKLRSKYSKALENMNSLSTRFKFICRSYEKTIFFAIKQPNNDTFENMLYHFGFFIMLCTGAYDDIAWLINNIYDLKLNRMAVSLRNSEFIKKIYHNDNSLYSLLSREEYLYKIGEFYPIRDSLQHRNYLSGYTYIRSSESSHMIYLETTAVKMLKEKIYIRESKEMDELGKDNIKYSCNPKELIEYLMKSFISSISEIFEAISWGKLVEQLNEKDLKEYDTYLEKYGKGVEQFLDFPSESMYF